MADEGSALELPRFIRLRIPVKKKQRNYVAALNVYPTVCVGALLSVALFDCTFSIGCFFG